MKLSKKMWIAIAVTLFFVWIFPPLVFGGWMVYFVLKYVTDRTIKRAVAAVLVIAAIFLNNQWVNDYQSKHPQAKVSATPTATPKATATPKPTQKPTATPTTDPKVTPSATPTPTLTPTATQTPTPTLTPKPTNTPTPTPTEYPYDKSLGNNDTAAKFGQLMLDVSNSDSEVVSSLFVELPEKKNKQSEADYQKSIVSVFVTVIVSPTAWSYSNDADRKDVVAAWVMFTRKAFPGAIPHIYVKNGYRTVAEGSFSVWSGEPSVTLK